MPTFGASSAKCLLHPRPHISHSQSKGLNLADLRCAEPKDISLRSVRRSLKILLLSDDERFTALVRSYLAHLGFQVFACSTANRAESLFLTRRDIDVWLIDVAALGMEAMRIAVKVRNLDPKVPIVLISEGHQDEGVIQGLFRENCFHVRKPVELPHLLAVVNRALSAEPCRPQPKQKPDDLGGLFDKDWINFLLTFPNRGYLPN
jgi:CheY-like chemotaxis protein